MKFIPALLLSFLAYSSMAQIKLPVVRSNTKSVTIIENDELITDWNLDSKIHPDLYIAGKADRFRTVKMRTDIDSIVVKLKPGAYFDFVVLFNNTDSCFTRFKAKDPIIVTANKKEKPDTIPFVLSPDNNILISGILNKKDSIKLLFDTGAEGFYLLKTAIKKYLNPEGKPLTMKDISDNHFQVSAQNWAHQRVHSLETTGNGCEGMIGWSAFDGRVLEINYDEKIMVLHSLMPRDIKGYEKFDMELMKEHFCIQVPLVVKNKVYKSRYLFDTGYQRPVMLDALLAKKNDIDLSGFEVIKKSKVFNSRNQEIPLLTVRAERLAFGNYNLENVPAQVNSYNQPAGYATNFLGGELIKRFNIILDFRKNKVFLKPNQLFNLPYAEG